MASHSYGILHKYSGVTWSNQMLRYQSFPFNHLRSSPRAIGGGSLKQNSWSSFKRAFISASGVLISNSDKNGLECNDRFCRYNAKMWDEHGRPPQAEGGVLAHAQRPPDSGGRAGHHGRRAPRLQVGGQTTKLTRSFLEVAKFLNRSNLKRIDCFQRILIHNSFSGNRAPSSRTSRTPA